MIRQCVWLCLMLLIVCISPVHAEIYVWTDDQGTVNFTEDLGTVPKKFRKSIRKFGEEDAPSAPRENTEQSPVISSNDPPQAAPGTGKVEAAPAGAVPSKNYDLWKKDLEEREAAMSALKLRMDEIASRLKNVPMLKDEQEKLVEEHKALYKQFNELKGQYNQQVEQARKDGMQITIQQ